MERFPLAGVKKAVDPKLIARSDCQRAFPTAPSSIPPVSTSSQTSFIQQDRRNTGSQIHKWRARWWIKTWRRHRRTTKSPSQCQPTAVRTMILARWLSATPSEPVLKPSVSASGLPSKSPSYPCLLAQPQSRSLYRPFAPPRDLCVSAPTGSGKTLAYSVLSSRYSAPARLCDCELLSCYPLAISSRRSERRSSWLPKDQD